MRIIISFAFCLAVLCGSVGEVKADNLYDMLFSNCVPNCIKRKQCDDYCPKGLPYAKPICDGQCDDYCTKPLPCARPTCATSCDDYCAKPIPKICCPCTTCETRGRLGSVPSNTAITAKQNSIAEIAAKPERFVLPQPKQLLRKPKSEPKSRAIDYRR